MDKHICPKCSQECVYKNGIMCTIDGCIKDGTAKNNNFNDIFNNIFGGANNMFNGSSNNPFADILNKYKN